MIDLTKYSEYETTCGSHTSATFGTGTITGTCTTTACTIVVQTDSARYVGATLPELTYSILLSFPNSKSITLTGKIEVKCTAASALVIT